MTEINWHVQKAVLKSYNDVSIRNHHSPQVDSPQVDHKSRFMLRMEVDMPIS